MSTKLELEARVKELESKIEELSHLSEAVQAKDREINNLKDENKNFRLNSEIIAQQQIDSKLADAKVEHERIVKEKIDEIEMHKKTIAWRERQLTESITIHGDLLKILESATNVNLNLNALFVKNLGTRNEGEY